MSRRRGINARAWFYGQSFHAALDAPLPAPAAPAPAPAPAPCICTDTPSEDCHSVTCEVARFDDTVSR
jgi:hypothetical protein